MLRLQARGDPNPAVQAALHSAIGRVEVISKVHDTLHVANRDDGKIHLAPYIQTLCGSIGDLQRGVRPIAIRVRCDDVSPPATCAANVGLIVNELVTNAFKYAFPDDQPGTVDVDIRARGRNLEIVVKDDGAGCPADAKGGIGTRLISNEGINDPCATSQGLRGKSGGRSRRLKANMADCGVLRQ